MKKLPPPSPEVSASRYVYFGHESEGILGLSIKAAGWEKCLPTYRVYRPGFACHGIELVTEGRGEVILNGESFPLFPGVLFSYGPRTVHDIRCDPERPMGKYFVDFSGREAASILRRHGLAPGSAIQLADVESSRFFFEQILSPVTSERAHAREAAELCLQLILHKVRDGLPPARESAAASNFSRWRAYLDTHFARLLNLEQMAHELHTRPSQICRVFQQFGQPRPFRYLTRKKMNRAAELLASQHYSVQSAAAEVGYEDPYHFSRLFKAHFGKAPSAFVRLAGRSSSSP